MASAHKQCQGTSWEPLGMCPPILSVAPYLGNPRRYDAALRCARTTRAAHMQQRRREDVWHDQLVSAAVSWNYVHGGRVQDVLMW